MRSFFQFIRRPDAGLVTEAPLRVKIRVFLGALEALILLMIFSGLIVSLLSLTYRYWTNGDFYDEVMLRSGRDLKEVYSAPVFYIIAFIGAPIIEEIAFRLYLKPDRFTLALCAGLIFLFFTFRVWYYKSYTQMNTYFYLLISFIISFLIYHSVNQRLIFGLGGKYFKYLFYH